MAEMVNILDVTPRDGLQNESTPVSTPDKLALIKKMVCAGVRDIQATSFVHPRWVPQMADAEAVVASQDIPFSARRTSSDAATCIFAVTACKLFNFGGWGLPGAPPTWLCSSR